MKILILYTELAGYTIASIKALVQSGATVHLVRWPVNAEAPFDFSFGNEIQVYDRSKLDQAQLLEIGETVRPDLILCSGWSDKGYLAVCKAWFHRIPVVLAMDNKWHGTAKQQLARLISGITIRRTFTHCWVPGEQQKLYARKLGFANDKIKTGFYTCDTELFTGIYNAQREGKQNVFPHVFIYAGRYYGFKGVEELWAAFIRFKNETSNDWKLVCLGTGDITPVQHEAIEHKGFIQPEAMEEVMKHSGVFILPSRFEPWAVVVQEFAVAGFPVLLSTEVGAREAFLEDGQNGFSFPANSEETICRAFRKIAALNDQELAQMGARSHELGTKNTPERWAQTLVSFMAK